MNDNLNKTSLTDKILSKLKSGEFKMKPRAYFVLKAALIILGTAVVAGFILFLISFISFALRANGVLVLPIFGFRGFGMFLSSLPWLLIIVAVLLIFVLEMLFKHFAFAYRRPILYSVLGIVIIVILGTFIIDRTPLHSGLFGQAQRGGLPVFGPVYRGFGGMQKPNNANFGVVSEKTEDGFVMKTRDEQTIIVIIEERTRLPFGKDLKKDDAVMVLGKLSGDTIKAEGVIKVGIDENLKPFGREFLPPMRPEMNR